MDVLKEVTEAIQGFVDQGVHLMSHGAVALASAAR